LKDRDISTTMDMILNLETMKSLRELTEILMMGPGND